MRSRIGLLIGVLLAAGLPASAQEQASAVPPEVETAAVVLAPVTAESEFVGTVQAIQQVDLVARVEGFLDEVAFSEGGFLKSGDIAFRIEKDTYEAALASAKATAEAAVAAEAGAQANLTEAQLTLARQQALLKSNTVSQAQVDQAQAQRDSADAQVKQAQAQISQANAQVTTAQLNLGFTDIVAPIAGRVGRAQVTVGNLVSASTGPLATIVQTDPIRVAFSISDRDYLEVVHILKPSDEAIAPQPGEFRPKLILPNGEAYDQPGKMSFIDNTIDPSTGTIAVFAEFPNPHLQLVPGQFVSITVDSGEPRSLPVIPAAAVQRDQEGPYVFTLDQQNRAVIRRITLGQRVGVNWAVTSGIAAGEVIIVSGIQRIRPGIVVSPKPAPAAAPDAAAPNAAAPDAAAPNAGTPDAAAPAEAPASGN